MTPTQAEIREALLDAFRDYDGGEEIVRAMMYDLPSGGMAASEVALKLLDATGRFSDWLKRCAASVRIHEIVPNDPTTLN